MYKGEGNIYREENTSYGVSKDEGEVIEEENIVTLQEKEKMISKDIQGEPHQRFISFLSEFPKLFINDYSHIRGVDVIKYHIKLKESVPITQKLRLLGIVQKCKEERMRVVVM